MSSNAPPVQVRTFRVVRPLSPEDVASFKAQYSGVDALMPLKVGYIGHIPQKSFNYGPNNAMKKFVWVQIMHYTATGLTLISHTPTPEGKCLVPASHIETGPIVTGKQKVISDLVLANLSLRQGSTHGASPLRRFLESIYLSLSEGGTEVAIKALGVPERVAGLLAQSSKRQSLIKELLDGKYHDLHLSNPNF